MRSVHFAGPEEFRLFITGVLNDLIGPGLWAFDDVIEGFRWYGTWDTRPDMHDEGLCWEVGTTLRGQPFILRPIKPRYDPNGAAAWPEPDVDALTVAGFTRAIHALDVSEICEAFDKDAIQALYNDLLTPDEIITRLTPETPAGLERIAENFEAEDAVAPQRLVTSAEARKHVPLVTGLLDYFPDALAAVAALSHGASVQHGHDEMFWERGKSNDHADCLARHLLDRGTADVDGYLHSTKVAWRALANLQLELEAARGLPISRGSR